MILAILYACLIALFIIIGVRKNKYSLIFAIIFASMGLIMFSSAMSIIKFSNYRAVFQLEFYFYRVLDKAKFSYYDLKSIINLGIVGILAAMYTLSLYYPMKTKTNSWLIRNIMLFSFAMLLFLALNSTGFGEHLFLMRHDGSSNKELSKILEWGTRCFDFAMILLCCLLPFYRLLTEYKNTQLLLKKLWIKSIASCLLLVDVIFLGILFSSFTFNFIYYTNIFDFDQVKWSYNQQFNIYFSIFFTIATSIVCLILLKYKVFDIYLLHSKMSMKKVYVKLYDLRHIFHTFKNYAMVIVALQKKAEENYGNDEGMKNLIQIKETAFELAKQAGDFIEIYNHPSLRFDKVNVVSCVSEALSRLSSQCSVESSIEVMTDITSIYADKNAITEMCYNIVQNSADAILKKDAGDGKITVRIMAEEHFVCLSFSDNGCGMDWKMRRNVFKPFVSSKRNFDHWGLGLSQVYNVVKAHYGYINITSRLNKFTEIQTVFTQYL